MTGEKQSKGGHMTSEKKSIEIITPVLLNGDSGDVTFIRGDERIETTWDKVFAVEAL